MDMLGSLAEGFTHILDVKLLLMLMLGVLVGSIVGVLPGIGSVGAMAILLPLSFSLDPAAGLLMTAGIYLGAQYGGSTTSILVGVPGEASAVVTTLDGYPMAKKGRAGAALAVAAIGSFIAGSLAVALLAVVATPLSNFAAQFSSAEFLLISLFALVVLARLAGGSALQTFGAVGIGLILSMIGMDPVTGASRFTFGNLALVDGVEITAVAVGMFGIAEILLMAENREQAEKMPNVPFRSLLPTGPEMRRAVPAMFRGGILGFFLGLLPGPSGVTSSYAAYAVEKKLSKHKEEFGHGAIEGVAGPESANNGASGGAMVPLLILGLPFNGPTALLLAAFTVQGVIPGPMFMSNEPVLFWTLVAGLFAANIALLILNLPLVGMFTSLLRIPPDLLMTFVVLIAIIGTYSSRGSMVDVVWLFGLGILGYVLAKLGISRVGVMLAFVIGPILETSLRQTLQLAEGNLFPYVIGRPISLVITILIGVAVFAPMLIRQLIAKTAPVPEGMGVDPS